MKRNRSVNTTNGLLTKMESSYVTTCFGLHLWSLPGYNLVAFRILYNMLKGRLKLLTLLDCNLTMATNAGRNMQLHSFTPSQLINRILKGRLNDMIYLLTAVGLSPGGSTHLHTNNPQYNTNNNRTTQIQTHVEECGPWPVFASFTLAFALQLRKKHGKTSVRVRKTSVRLRKTSVKVQYTYYQKHPHITKPSQTHTLQNPLIQHKGTRARTHYKTI